MNEDIEDNMYKRTNKNVIICYRITLITSLYVVITKLNNMKMNFVFAGTILAFGLVSGQGFQKLIIKSITVDLKPNPYVNSVDVEISGEFNDTVTVKMPILEEVTEDISLTNYIIYNGEEIPPLKGDLCGVFDDKMFAPDVLEAGVPKDEFPKQCPILPNNDYTILNYKFSTEKLPPGLPDGTVISKIYASRTDDDSDHFIYIHADSVLQTDLPNTPPLMG